MASGPHRERIWWQRPPALPGVEILAADHTTRRYAVFHETYTFCVVLDRGGEWTYRGRSHCSTAGQVMLLEPGEIHRTTHLLQGETSFRVVQLPPAEIERAAVELGLALKQPHLRVANVENDPVLAETLRAFHRSLERQTTPLEQESRLAAALHRILALYAERSLPSRRMRAEPTAVIRVRDYLHAHYADPVHLAECAAIAGLSRFHFLRAFTKHIGLPPHAYQTQVRIAYARRLLRAGAPPAHVAAEVGFADQSHLGRLFRRVLGVTPAAYMHPTQ